MATRTFLAGMAVMLLFHVAAAQQCAITASQAASLDYTPIKTGCANLGSSPSETACNTCLCAFNTVFAPPIQASGASFNNLTRQQVTDALSACTNVVLPALTRAGVSVTTLIGLQSCTTLPPCFNVTIAGSPPPMGR